MEQQKLDCLESQLKAFCISYGFKAVHQTFEKILHKVVDDIQQMKKQNIFEVEVPAMKEIYRAEIPKIIPMEKEIPETIVLEPEPKMKKELPPNSKLGKIVRGKKSKKEKSVWDNLLVENSVVKNSVVENS
jgi:hypothetical protein